MLIKESALRRIIREEALLALREDEESVPEPAATAAAKMTPTPTTDAPKLPVKEPLTDSAEVQSMVRKKLKVLAAQIVDQVYKTGSDYGDAAGSRIEAKFDILPTGLVDRNTIKLTLNPPMIGSSGAAAEKAWKQQLGFTRFDPIAKPLIGYEWNQPL
jgi:hypothetical protein